MDSAIQSPPDAGLSPARIFLFATIGAGWLGVVLLRLWLGRGLPLWVDETWTAVIAGQSSWSGFWSQAWLDPNAPLYYAVMALWTDIAGVSNAALRAPSFVFVVLAGLAPVTYRAPGLSLEASLAWGALLYFWLGSTAISLDARVYALLLLLSVLQTVAFVRLLDQPSRRTAWIWAGLASAAILSHYYALCIAAVQAAMLLALEPRSIKRVWPALLAFVPSAAWLLYHLPRLVEYARPDVVWYVRLDAGTTLGLIYHLIGPWTWRFPLSIALVLVALWILKGRREEEIAPSGPLNAAVIAGLAALALVLVIGLMRPVVTARYLVPLVPPALLGLVLLARQVNRAHLAYALLCALFLAPYARIGPLRQSLAERSANSLEPAAAYLAGAGADRLILFWDHPGMQIAAPESLRQFGEFFFRRVGRPLHVVPVNIPRGVDAGPRLIAAATGERPAIIWLYDVERRPESRSPGRGIEAGPGWRCRRFLRGGGRGLLACVRFG